MKKICSFLKNLIILAYILLIIFITVCLLSYNDYKVTVFGKNTILPIIDEDLEPDYIAGDLLIIEQNKLSSIKEGDEIFFYRVAGGEVSVSYANVIDTERVDDNKYQYTVEGGYSVYSSNFIGKTDTAIIIPKVGNFFSILQSKWGFLFLVVFPSLIAFLYTLYSVILELKETNSESEEDEKSEDKKERLNLDNETENIEDGNDSEVEVNEAVIEEEKTEETSEKNDEFQEEKAEENNESQEEKVEENDESKEVKEEENPEGVYEEKEEIDSKEQEVKEDVQSENQENDKKTEEESKTEEEKRKALIEAKLKSMTEEEKRALIEAKLKSMTEEEKRAFIEAKKKKQNPK